MANHVRKQLRDAIAAAVNGLTTTGASVFGRRVYALQTTQMPALSVYVPDEDGQDITVHAPAVRERLVGVRVRAYAAGDQPDDTLDTIAKEVEAALAAGVTVGAKTVRLAYAGSEFDWDVGEKPYGMVELRFTATIHNSANAPDSLT